VLFFHNHIPDYSEWTAKLYETTHQDFVWDPGTWTYNNVAQFNKFKEALCLACTLHFPDYSLPWFIRCDASQYAVGGVLFQVRTNAKGEETYEPIGFVSKRFSKPAENWDAYKREAYGLYFTVLAFSYYLRGKSFTLETDHRNLQWIESSMSPIVIRWRALLQSFDFMIRHIAGRLNRVADFLSRIRVRIGEADLARILTLGVAEDSSPPAFEAIMQQVHGKRSLHFGATETWRRAKLDFPRASISLEAVRRFVKECAICQKMRDTGVKGLPEQILSLKPETYRRTVGIDHVTVTPADAYGNTCVVLIVEHFSHFPQAYAAKDYSAETAAKTLFRHFMTFGAFDELASDPGSAFMSDVVTQLNQWLGVRHKVSLVERHESNGCEGSGKQFIRHLKTLVSDERMLHKWSDDTILPLINFEMASFPTKETGGLTPFQLKYGTQDAKYFQLPEPLEPGPRCHALLKKLDEELKTIREVSKGLQDAIVAERAADSELVPQYEVGDFVLWNPKETPCSHLESKLAPAWMGPYEVVQQIKNDVECVHVNLRTRSTFHVSRLKPFVGSLDDALIVAKLDKNQFFITAFN
jgi:hypothetical protein